LLTYFESHATVLYSQRHALTQDRTYVSFFVFLQHDSTTHDHPSTNLDNHRQLIIHGRTAVRGRYPYFCTLDHYGGGALIAPDIILTAGHCKPGRRGDVQPRVGTYNFKHDVEGKDYEAFRIDKMVRHPGFVHVGADEFIRDFTILKLKGQSSKPVVRINRHAHVPADGQPVTAMGMGNTHADYESKSVVLKQVVLNAISNDACEESESDSNPDREDESYQGRIFPSHMCTTGGPHNERDAWYVLYILQTCMMHSTSCTFLCMRFQMH
jgi:hypothetical protein